MTDNGQWFEPTVKNLLPRDIVLKFYPQNGYFYDINNPFKEISPLERVVIDSRANYTWGHCGIWKGSPIGTEGSFEVHFPQEDEKVAEIHWASPMLDSHTLTVVFKRPGYNVRFQDFNIDQPGPLGKGIINVSYQYD